MSGATAAEEYHGVRTADYDDYDDSATEVGDTLPDQDAGQCWDEKHLHMRSHHHSHGGALRRVCTAVFSLRNMLDAILLLVIIGFLAERRLERDDMKPEEGHEGSGDLTGFAPRISQQIKTFKPDFSYVPENASEFFTPEVQDRWLDMVPMGLGYVEVPHPEAYKDLPTPLTGYAATVFTTAMTHQLHCLHTIVEAYSGLVSNNTDQAPREAWHLSHCFEYLRQSIMCCGDTALEGQATTFPFGVTGSDGWDAKHVCKNYDQIYGYLEENRANNDVWI